MCHDRCVELERHPALRFDVLSLNCGAAPGFGAPADADVGDSGQTDRRLPAALARIARRRCSNGPTGERNVRVVIVGGGAGGVELALAVHHALVAIAPSVRLRS